MKSSRNIRNYFRVAAKYCRILLLFRAGIVIVVVISGVATAQSSSATSPSPAKTSAPAEDKAIRPFHFKAPDAALVDLKRRIAATTRLFPHRVLFREHTSLSVDQWNRPSWRAKMNAQPATFNAQRRIQRKDLRTIFQPQICLTSTAALCESIH